MEERYMMPADDLPELIQKIQSIQSSQTKKRDQVLKTIYEAGQTAGAEHMNHRNLAEKMDLTIYALSNIVSKIENSEWQLIAVEREGRNKYYSLTDLGKQYVESCLLNTSKDQDRTGKVFVVGSAGEIYYSRADEALQSFRERWGDVWDDKLYEFLKNNAFQASQEMSEDFGSDGIQLIEAVKNLYLKKEEKYLQKIYDTIEEKMLVKALKNYLLEMEAYWILCQMDQDDWFKTYRLIDKMFEQNCLVNLDAMLDPFIGWRSKEQLSKVISCVSSIMKVAKSSGMKRNQVFDQWKALFPAHERLIYYIAEKYSWLSADAGC